MNYLDSLNNFVRNNCFYKENNKILSKDLYLKFLENSEIKNISIKSFVKSFKAMFFCQYKKEIHITQTRVGKSVFKTLLHVSTKDTPVSTKDTPVSTKDTPVSTKDTPVSTKDTPVSTKDTPVSTKKIGKKESLFLEEQLCSFIERNFLPKKGSTILFKDVFSLWKEKSTVDISSNKFSRTFAKSWEKVYLNTELKKRVNLGKNMKDVGYENIKFK